MDKTLFVKRFAVALLLSCLLSNAFALNRAFAAEQYPEVKTASKFSRTLQKATGFTLVTGWIANRILRRELAEHIDGKLDSNLKLYSGTDLLKGKAKKIEITGRNVLLDDFIPLSDFRFESTNETPIFVKAEKHAFLLRPVQFKVSATMTERDINAMLQSEKGKKALTDMRVTLPPFGKQSFDALDPAVDIDGEKLIIKSLMNIHGAPKENALPLTLSGKVSANQSRLSLSELDIQIEGIEDTQEVAQLVERYFGELVNLNKLKVKRHKVKVNVQRSDLKDDRLNMEALVTVEPDKKTLQKYLASVKK